MRRFYLAFALLLALQIFYGCKKSEPAKAEPKKLTIAVIPKGTTHEFWKAIHAGANQAGAELNVEVIWKGPLKEDDREAQIKVVEDFVTRGVSGIVLAPLDDTALRAPVGEAVNAGIPVVIIDSGLKSGDFVSFVATDNYKGGILAGEHLAKLLGGKGKVLLLRYQEGSASTTEREQGFLDAVKKYPDLQVASSNQFGGATVETAFTASENLLSSFKGPDGSLSVQGIFCPNLSTAFGMLRALQEEGFAGKVRFVGFDSTDKFLEALKKGEMDALVLQNPMLMGYLGVKTMIEHLQGKPVEKRIDTGVYLVTKDNMDTPEMKQLLSPDLGKWLK
jgi:ribose transport system substrate-binding protein